MDLIKDLSVLTTIPEKNLHSLVNKYIWCIYDNVHEQHLKNETINIDLEIGNLYITIIDDIVKYKFIPKEDFNSQILKVLQGENILKTKVGKTLVDKICNTYKDMF